MRRLLPLLALALLVGCAGTPNRPAAPGSPGGAPPLAQAGPAPDCRDFVPYPAAQEDPSTRGDYVAGGLYKPGVRDTTPDYLPRVDCIPEPAVVDEPRSAYGNRSPYSVLGRSYRVLDSTDGFVETGIASYYGNKFHGRRTSNQEVYDMYAFSAAHKSLPLPSFARVTNLDNGRSVVVRVNDRGPFHDGRVIDLSYAAAVKLDIHRRGTGRVEVRALRPGEAANLSARAAPAPQAPAAPSGMDALVGQLPATAPVAATPPPVAPAPPPAQAAAGTLVQVAAAPAARMADHPGYGRAENRFRLVAEDGRVRSADEFEAWMRARQARLDGEQAQTVQATVQASPGAAPLPAQVAPSSTASLPPAHPDTAADGVTLQVAVFSVRDNAERALGALQRAGIGTAHLQDVRIADRQLWRLRVGPVAEVALAELASRVSGLGLGVPQIVRE